jgi:antitoxin (DNA-binding transcriptional repressor) of toxin-antitoxin stability system
VLPQMSAGGIFLDIRSARTHSTEASSVGVALCRVACDTSGMSRVIAQRDLRNQNAQILAAVEAGASFVATHNGTPVAELGPLASGRRPFVPRAEIATLPPAALVR